MQGSQRPYFDCQLSYHCNDVCALHDVVSMVSCHLSSSAFTSYKSKAVTNCTQFFYSRKLGKNTTIYVVDKPTSHMVKDGMLLACVCSALCASACGLH